MPVPTISMGCRAVDDFEQGTAQNGNTYWRGRVAASDSKKLDNGEWENTREFFVAVTWWEPDPRVPLPRKGDYLQVAGTLQTDTWEKDGEKRSAPKVNAWTIRVFPKSGGEVPPADLPPMNQQQQAWPQQAPQQPQQQDPWNSQPQQLGFDSNPPF